MLNKLPIKKGYEIGSAILSPESTGCVVVDDEGLFRVKVGHHTPVTVFLINIRDTMRPARHGGWMIPPPHHKVVTEQFCRSQEVK